MEEALATTTDGQRRLQQNEHRIMTAMARHIEQQVEIDNKRRKTGPLIINTPVPTGQSGSSSSGICLKRPGEPDECDQLDIKQREIPSLQASGSGGDTKLLQAPGTEGREGIDDEGDVAMAVSSITSSDSGMFTLFYDTVEKQHIAHINAIENGLVTEIYPPLG